MQKSEILKMNIFICYYLVEAFLHSELQNNSIWWSINIMLNLKQLYVHGFLI